ncbi:cytochrome c oxidase subunit 6A, mitochondrial [Platichthys flesus]|uniref:cytochrome c oxidase subunit 6A, mitochondrial n=1 Tax=Platichthys flesus TaxID=8260 RepID=UPI002DB9F7BC|nr:cytochrome c oxidase subunit 6A, mitochondrial [Platichthys flesus]
MSVSPVAMVARRTLAAASHSSHEGKAKTWKIMSFVLAIPGVAVCWLNAYMKGQAHSHEQAEFVPYTHLRIRTKKFPWGDGNHSLFHNPHTNALPDGFESTHH